MIEYKMCKETYIMEYQENYQVNLNAKQDNISQFMETIEDKKIQLQELEKLKEQNESCM